jgi:Bacterial type II and III secretion system protein
MSFLLSLPIVQQAKPKMFSSACFLLMTTFLVTGCADAVGPHSRTAAIPAPKIANERQTAINENGEPVIYLPLGDDVLLPQSAETDHLPDTIVGPFELRGETLAGALQLIMDGVDVPVAFESTSSLTENITVTNLKGPVSQVVNDVCALANTYCAYQGGVLVVKDREIFTVTIPPIVASADVSALLTNISAAIGSITGETPIADPSTRTIVYRASQRTAEMAKRYFQRLRSNTALIIYETYIWEVSLESGNSTGIKWSLFDQAGSFKFGINFAGSTNTNLGTPVSIGLPTKANINFTTSDVFQFISSYGAVKTISQPQISVLSGSSAKLRIADKQNYLASFSRTTTDGGTSTISTTTGSVDSGFTLNIGSNWDSSTVYGTIDILLQEVQSIDTFDENPDAIVQLPQTTERELNTTVRVRPGDALLIAGLVRESDRYTKEGPGLMDPIIPTSRSATTTNTELVFLMRPRVVVFTTSQTTSPRITPMSAVTIPPVSMVIPDSSPVIEPMSNVAPSTPVVEISKSEFEDMAPVSPNQSPSIEIQPLSSVEAPKQSKVVAGDPSVIVNYDVLGQ